MLRGGPGAMASVDNKMKDLFSNFEEKILMEPYTHVASVKGNEFRTRLGLAFNHWLNISEEMLQLITYTGRVGHNISLLIDDMQDGSELRRGVPVAHHIYGATMTFHSLTYVHLKTQRMIIKLKCKNHFQQVLFDRLLELTIGQHMDVYWRDAFICPTVEQYKQMVLKKTAGMFRLTVALMQVFSDCKTDFVPLLNNMGLYFQIRDDYANLYSKEYASTKGYAEDLSEGKFSFPAVYGIKLKPENNIIIGTLRERPACKEKKKRCIDYMESIGCFSYTRSVLKDLENKITKQISDHGGNPDLEKLILNLNIDKLNPIN